MIRLLIAVLFAASGAYAGILSGEWHRKTIDLQTKLVRNDKRVANSTYLLPDIFVTSVVRDRTQLGFAILRFAVECDLAMSNRTGVDDAVVLADAVNAVMFNRESAGPGGADLPEVSAVADEMLAVANLAAEGKRFRRALILQVDLFDRTEVRKRVVVERIAKD